MSAKSLRNVVRRRIHKERSQPHRRRKLGLLEKHKDYKLRAKDFHRKADTLKALREKAAMRNPDEFYFAMNNSQLKNGIHRDTGGGKSHSAKALKIMNTQDVAYLNTHKVIEAKKIEKLKSELHMLDGKKRAKHTIFFDESEKDKLKNFSPAEYFDTHPDLVDRVHNRPRKAALESGAVLGVNKVDARVLAKADKEKSKRYRELSERIDRQKDIDKQREKIQTQRNLMTKGTRTKHTVEDKFGDVDESQTHYVWKLERKK